MMWINNCCYNIFTDLMRKMYPRYGSKINFPYHLHNNTRIFKCQLKLTILKKLL